MPTKCVPFAAFKPFKHHPLLTHQGFFGLTGTLDVSIDCLRTLLHDFPHPRLNLVQGSRTKLEALAVTTGVTLGMYTGKRKKILEIQKE